MPNGNGILISELLQVSLQSGLVIGILGYADGTAAANAINHGMKLNI